MIFCLLSKYNNTNYHCGNYYPHLLLNVFIFCRKTEHPKSVLQVGCHDSETDINYGLRTKYSEVQGFTPEGLFGLSLAQAYGAYLYWMRKGRESDGSRAQPNVKEGEVNIQNI